MFFCLYKGEEKFLRSATNDNAYKKLWGGFLLKKNKLFVLSTSLTLAMTFLLSGCSGGEGEKTSGSGVEKKTIKVAHYFAENHPQNIALKEKFKKMVWH